MLWIKVKTKIFAFKSIRSSVFENLLDDPIKSNLITQCWPLLLVSVNKAWMRITKLVFVSRQDAIDLPVGSSTVVTCSLLWWNVWSSISGKQMFVAFKVTTIKISKILKSRTCCVCISKMGFGRLGEHIFT